MGKGFLTISKGGLFHMAVLDWLRLPLVVFVLKIFSEEYGKYY